MRRRTRALIGLALVSTMGLSLAETVWASACSPTMEEAVGSASTGSMDDMQPMHEPSGSDLPAGHDCMPGHAHEPTHDNESGSSCPFAPAGAAQGCAATASLPAAVATPVLPVPLYLALRSSILSVPHLISAASIFHPPKA